MSARKSLKLPIILGVVMILLLVALTVGWVVLTVVGALADSRSAGLYWTILSIGTVFLVLVLVGVVIYLALSVKAINLTRRQSNFIDSVTHELKSPIASLKLYLQTLTRHKVDQSQQESFYQFMLDDVARLDHLVSQVLDAGQIEKPRVDGAVPPVELSQVLRDCAEMTCLRYRVPECTIDFALQPCQVRATRADLELIFRNLIDNAVKYAGAEPKVDVSVRPLSDDRVVVSIGDNGPGIPRHLRRRIFGRFVRLHFEREPSQPGTGLGLYIVRTLVHRLRGSIRVRDREDGSGSVFEVRLRGEVVAVGDDLESNGHEEARSRSERPPR
jgi:two-component system phosphate regulon sensor histidine kinase PhoR